MIPHHDKLDNLMSHLYCVHYMTRRPSDGTPLKGVVNGVPGADEVQAALAARKTVESVGYEYVTTLKAVRTDVRS